MHQDDGHPPSTAIASESRGDHSRRRRPAKAALLAKISPTVLEALPEATLLFAGDGSFIRSNEKATRLFDITATNVPISAHAPDATHSSAAHTAAGTPFDEAHWPVARVLRGETIPADGAVDVCLTLPGHGSVMIACSGSPILDGSGHVLGALVVCGEKPPPIAAQPTTQPKAQPQSDTADALPHLLGTVFEILADAVIVLDADGALLWHNAAARRLFSDVLDPGYVKEPFSELRQQVMLHARDGSPLPPDEWPSARVLRGETLVDAKTQDIGYTNRAGHQTWLNASGVPLLDGERITGAVVVYRDVTERRLAEQHTHAVLNALLEMAELVVQVPTTAPAPTTTSQPIAGNSESTESADQGVSDARNAATAELAVAKRMADLTRRVLGCSRVAIISIDPETRRQHPIAVVGLTPEQERAFWVEQEAQPPFGEGGDPELNARLMAGETLVFDMTQPPYDSLPNPYNIHTVAIAPMQVGDKLVGLLSLDHSRHDHVYTEPERQLMGAVAHLGALVIERERLFREQAQGRADLLAAEEANRRMNSFLGMASHELRTPVTSLLPAAEMILNWAEQAAAQQEAPTERTLKLTRRICAQTKRLRRLVDDLIDFARERTDRLELAMEPVDVAALAREMAEEVSDIYAERTVIVEAPEEPIFVSGDPLRLEQAVTNFLSNAIKYSPADAPVHVSITREATTAQVAVRDDGPGIALEDQAHVWELYYRGPNDSSPRGGVNLGMGLFITKMVIDRHGGTCGVESTPGHGSTFWFRVPLADPASD